MNSTHLQRHLLYIHLIVVGLILDTRTPHEEIQVPTITAICSKLLLLHLLLQHQPFHRLPLLVALDIESQRVLTLPTLLQDQICLKDFQWQKMASVS